MHLYINWMPSTWTRSTIYIQDQFIPEATNKIEQLLRVKKTEIFQCKSLSTHYHLIEHYSMKEGFNTYKSYIGYKFHNLHNIIKACVKHLVSYEC